LHNGVPESDRRPGLSSVHYRDSYFLSGAPSFSIPLTIKLLVATNVVSHLPFTQMIDPALHAALGAVARAFPDHFCKAEQSSPGMISFTLYLCSDSSIKLRWVATSEELTGVVGPEGVIARMQAALLDGPDWPC
jgi:hypothetical protein